MKTTSKVGWISVVLLSAVCLWTTGCGGGDGDPGSDTTTVVTNTVGGTTTVVTNAPATPPAQQLVEPQVISPQSGLELYSGNPTLGVEFHWTAVPGAVGYVLSVDGMQYDVSSTKTSLRLPVGIHTWSVCGVISRTAGNGPSSSQATFAVQPIGLVFP